MKYGIELNGVANIHCLLSLLEENLSAPVSNGCSDACVAVNLDSIKDQLDVLERYMLAYARAVDNGITPPAWHEVRDNISLYPKNNGK